MMVCVSGGAGLAVWTDTVWPAPCGIVVGIMLLIAGVMMYRRLDEAGKDTAYRYLAALFYAESGFLFGGMPGALIGRGVAGETGEMFGCFATAIPISIWNASRGWQTFGTSRKPTVTSTVRAAIHPPNPCAETQNRSP